MLSWILPGVLFSQTKDIHCFDLNESRKIHQLAAQKFYGDSLIATLEGKVIILENDNKETTKDYMALLDNTALKIYEQGQREAGLMKIIDNYRTEIRSVRKKSRWRSIKLWAAIVVGGTLIAIK